MAKTPTCALVMHPVVRDELLREDHLKRLAQATVLVSPQPYNDVQELASSVSHVDILITSWGCPPIDAAQIDLLPRLKLIAHLAGSVKGFLDDVVWRRGIRVTNAVAANAVPVAEFTLAAILFANKRVLQLNHFYVTHKENRAPWTREAPNVGNYGKVIGIVGASHVGRLVVRMLKPFDFRVLLYDPYISPSDCRAMGAQKVGISELMSQSDVVTLHAPLLPETRGMIGHRELAIMQDGATLINTARGQLIDQDALERELATGRIFAYLDTTTPEVLPPNSPLYRMPNVFLTPHITGSLGTETQRLADYLVAEIERFTKGMQLKYMVTREQLPRLA